MPRRAMEQATALALERLGQGFATTPAELVDALATLGDALRLGMPVPSGVRAARDRLGAGEIDLALGVLLDRAHAWASGADQTARVVERDRAASAVVAVVRAWAPRPLDALPNLAPLEDALEACDRELRRVASRAEVARLLGARAACEPRWADTFEEREGADADAAALDPAAVPLLAPPSDEVVTAYATRGESWQYVEAFASRDPAFGEELEALLGALLETGEGVSFAARRWRRTGLALAVVPPTRLAASTGEGEEIATTSRLGVLAPVSAEGRLRVTAARATFDVYPEPGVVLDEIQLGDAIAREPVTAEKWSVTSPVAPGLMRFRVRAGPLEFVLDVELTPVG